MKRVDMYTRVSHMALAVAVLLAGALVAVELTDRPSRASELEGVAIWRWEEQGPPTGGMPLTGRRRREWEVD